MDYYNQNAADFISATQSVDMQTIYSKFLPILPQGACILDAGCGSGRDSLYFKNQGFSVTAFDASSEMSKHASELIGQPVQQRRFQDMDYHDEFDGVWACASLLHVDRVELPDIYRRLSRAMKSNAVLYCSFKYGVDETMREGRCFTNMSEGLFERDIQHFSELSIIEMWRTGDQREGREHEQWFNALVRKGEGS